MGSQNLKHGNISSATQQKTLGASECGTFNLESWLLGEEKKRFCLEIVSARKEA
jgi:hypothetical protein